MQVPKILILERQLTVALRMRDTLRRAGFRVVGLSPNLEMALTVFHDEKPDVVISDIDLKSGHQPIFGSSTVVYTPLSEAALLDALHQVRKG